MTELLVTGRVHGEIARPLEVVRAHFLDLDCALRERIHHGVSLRWLPPLTSGERRFEQETKVLSRSQIDVLVIETRDGAVVRRFVGGPNAGAEIVASFLATTSETTEATLTAFAGRDGYRTSLGRLSPLGVEKLLEKTLDEHRKALVGYEPGRARGAVQKVLLPLRDIVVAARAEHPSDARAFLTNLLEATCAVAVADGAADDPERDVIREVAATLCFVDLDAHAVDHMVAKVHEAIASEGLDKRCDKIGARLLGLGIGEVGLGVAALVAQVSHGIGVEEHATLVRLGASLGVDEAGVDELLRKTDAALGRA